jgi:hypothetical protein
MVKEHAAWRNHAVQQMIGRAGLRGAGFEIRIGQRAYNVLGKFWRLLIGIAGFLAPRGFCQGLRCSAPGQTVTRRDLNDPASAAERATKRLEIA